MQPASYPTVCATPPQKLASWCAAVLALTMASTLDAATDSSPTSAKTVLEVRALDPIERVPVPGVTVNVVGTGRTGITDENGWTSLNRLVPGRAHLLVLFHSTRMDTTVEIAPEQTTTVIVSVAGPRSQWVEDYVPGVYGLSDLTIIVRDDDRRRPVRGILVYLRDGLDRVKQAKTNHTGRVKFKQVLGGDAHVWTRDTLGFQGKKHLVELMNERPERDSLFLKRLLEPR